MLTMFVVDARLAQVFDVFKDVLLTWNWNGDEVFCDQVCHEVAGLQPEQLRVQASQVVSVNV